MYRIFQARHQGEELGDSASSETLKSMEICLRNKEQSQTIIPKSEKLHRNIVNKCINN